jgi:hypothetical protein
VAKRRSRIKRRPSPLGRCLDFSSLASPTGGGTAPTQMRVHPMLLKVWAEGLSESEWERLTRRMEVDPHGASAPAGCQWAEPESFAMTTTSRKTRIGASTEEVKLWLGSDSEPG